MQRSKVSFSRVGMLLLAVAMMSCPAAAESQWLSVAPDGTVDVQPAERGIGPQVVAESAGQLGLSVAVDFTGLVIEPVKRPEGVFLDLAWPELASQAGEIGTPALPVVRKLFVVPPGMDVAYTVNPGTATTIDLAEAGLPADLMPVQAPIPKLPGARENAVFEFDAEAYTTDLADPEGRVTIEELGIVRGQRLFLLEMRPVGYNGALGQLTLWPQLNVDLEFVGQPALQPHLSPAPGLRDRILNPDALPVITQRGGDNYLIIVASALQSGISSFEALKTTQGYNVTTWVPTSASNTAIKTYIQSQYDGGNAPDFVLLIGDTNTIPHWTGGGAGSPDTDLPYSCMDGSSDWYPDFSLGRWPVRTTAQLQAIVDKTIYYQTGPLADPDYLKRAVFMAGDDNYQITEGTHEYCINTHLTPNDYVVDRVYEVTYGAGPADTAASFNSGRFFGIFSGHGSDLYWADGPEFHQSDVQALTNANMYSYVWSFACVTGTYADHDACYVETWIREANKGGIAITGSSVNSYWTEDDILQRRLFDSIFDADDDVDPLIGLVYNDTRLRYIAEMGSDSTTRRYYEMYNLMGDPTIKFPGACSDAGTITLNSAKYACEDTATITVGDCGLNTNDTVVDTHTVTIVSDTEPGGETVILTETDPASAEFVGTIGLSVTNLTGVLGVAQGDAVSVTYYDADDGSGSPATVVADAVVDCQAPVILSVTTTNIEPRAATVLIDADERVSGTVHFGTSCGSLTSTASGGFGDPASVGLAGLQDNHTYFYSVEVEDEAGNTTSDDNGGACYTFATPEVPDFFTELFDGSDNDLDNISLIFTPDGGNDFYAACAEEITALPTDPTGGTTLSLSDDSSQPVSVTGGQTVLLYGSTYSSLYVGSNGYLTFDHSETGYDESLEAHFGTPRISMVFDDLNPSSGGTVSYKQLADRMAITYQNVPEYNTSNSNTFQVELFFDGTITINYLAVAVSDGLAGLSAGEGLDPDFLENDLSALGNCGPKPPVAANGTDTTAMGTPVMCDLQATDDGLPDPPAEMVFIVESLPDYGMLHDPNDGAILSVPYTLLANGHQVIYEPDPGFHGPDGFTFMANDGGVAPEGGDSNVATVTVTVGGSAWTPVAYNVNSSTQINVPVTVELLGNDPNGDPLTYTLESLPLAGHLSDPDVPGVAIDTVPYDLPGRFVSYHPPCGSMYPEEFTFDVSDATATSNEATVTVSITTDDPRLVHNFSMDQDPGWSTEGQWEFGPATAGGSHNGDPGTAHTGSNVYGYNLGGDYANFMPEYFLTTYALDCSTLSNVELRFWRWLGVESYPGYDVDHATVEISSDGVDFDLLWENTGDSIDDDAWVEMVFDLTAYADGQETVFLRWGMGPTDNGVTYPGWNLDDVEIWGIADPNVADFNADAFVDLEDVELFELCLGGPDQGLALPCLCVDLDADGDVDLADFAEFQAAFVE